MPSSCVEVKDPYDHRNLFPSSSMQTMTEKYAHLRDIADKQGLQVDAAFCAMQLERMGIHDPRTVDPQLLATHMQTFHTMYHEHFGHD